MQRFDVLSKELNIFGAHLLEASAGTGKTFAIEHLVLRLLIDKNSPLLIDQILVVTFTRASTRELKTRVRKNLEMVGECLKTGDAKFDYVREILDLGPVFVKTARGKIEAALACFDQAQIFTIHGFCHRALLEFAFEANMGFGVSDPDSKEYKGIMRNVVVDFFRTGLSSEQYHSHQLAAVMKSHKSDIDKLSQKLLNILEKGVPVAPFPSYLESVSEFESRLSMFKGRSVKADLLLEDFKVLAPCYKKMNKEFFPQQVEQIGGILEGACCSSEGLKNLLEDKEVFLEGMHVENVKVRASFPSFLHYPGLFDEMRHKIFPVLVTAKDPQKILLRMARDCQKRWEKVFEHQEKLSPDEILKKMQEALCNPTFAQVIRQKYRAAFVDEFQDTDPVQWNIFKELFLKGENPVSAFYLVGDPKQSIYAFRNADVYTYMEAAEVLGSEKRAYLDTNYRSQPSLVNALNKLFSTERAPGWMQLPSRGLALEVNEVGFKPGGKDLFLADEKGAVHFFLAEDSPGREKSWPTQTLEERSLFSFIAKEASHLKNQAKLNFGQFAVLVKDRYQAARLQSYLKKKNIPASVKRNSSLVDSMALPAMIELLEAVTEPDDLSCVKKALGGPLICWSHHPLRNGLEDSNVQEAKVRMHELKELLQKSGFAPFFQEFLVSRWNSNGNTVLEELVSNEDLTFYNELVFLAQKLMEIEAQELVTPEGLLEHLMEFKKADPEEERLKIHADDDEDKISIMTIHVSKGLEFEIVFALGVASRQTRLEEWVRIKENGREVLEEFDLNKKTCEAALREQDAEKMRQLYVALTRAKHRVYVPLIFDLNQRDVDFGLASPIELFFARAENPRMEESQIYGNLAARQLSSALPFLEALTKECSVTYSMCSLEEEISNKDEPITQIELAMPSFPKIGGRPEFVFSFSSLSKSDHPAKKDHSRSKEIPSKDIKTLHSMPLGAETGNFLHYILEKIFGLMVYSDEVKIRSLIYRFLEKTPLEEWKDPIFDMVKEILHLPLMNGAFSLKDIPPGQMQQEMEFIFPERGSLIKGFADLVFEKDNKYYLIDWKSNWLGDVDEDYSDANIENCMVENDYFLQAAIYASAMERYVKLFDIRPFKECFGGAIYVFLRGRKAYHFFPDSSLIDKVHIKEAGKWE